MPVKRKSAASAASGAKRARNDVHENAKLVVAEAVTIPDEFELDCDINDEDSVRRAMLELAKYAHSLEEEVEEMKLALASTGSKAEKATKSPEKIAEEVNRIATTIVRGIKRQMSWKPSCKTNSSRFIFDGICPDPLVFSTLLRVEYPPKFKQKKILCTELERNVGKIQAHCRYNELYIASKEVLLRYNAESGEFKISGDYGISHWVDPSRRL